MNMSEMPNQPTVAAIMLANGRPEMVARAMKCFDAQTYDNRIDVIWDNDGSRSIGALRNEANQSTDCDIICHWDSDDWSHPNRIAEQVALLQSSGAECVGYNEMLFWETSDPDPVCHCGIELSKHSVYENHPFTGMERPGEAWLYRASIPKYAIGTSMCYWRKTWERHPFPDRSEGCDDLYWFNAGVKITSVSSGYWNQYPTAINSQSVPHMIASIHGGNTCASIDAKAREWTRVPEWDNYAREAMRL